MVDTTRTALNLWAVQLVPSLFPFMILSNLFLKLSRRYFSIHNNLLNKFCQYVFGSSVYGYYIIILGHICGYPLGAKITADAYKNGEITFSEASYLLTICNQSSPAFLEYYIAAYALGGIIPTYKLLLLFYFAAFLTSMITRYIYPIEKIESKIDHMSYQTNERSDLFLHLDQSITDSCITILRVGGYVVIFSILSNILLMQKILPETVTYPLAASLEITNGLFLLKSRFSASVYYPYFVIILTAFGGICTMAQIKGMLTGTSLSIKPYIIGKIIYTLIILLLTILFVKINIFHFGL